MKIPSAPAGRAAWTRALDTRRLVLVIALGMLAYAPASQAHHAKVIGVLYHGAASSSADLRALLDGMRDLGWVDGRNLRVDIHYAEGRTERFPEFAAAVVREKADVIVATGTPASVAAKNATSTIPIVMVAVSDPVGAKLVPSLARPEGNITGLSLLAPELSAKRVDLLKQTLPRLSRLGVLWNNKNEGMQLRFREVSAAAPALGIQVASFEVRSPAEFDEAFAAVIRERPEALLVMADTVTMDQRHRTVSFAETNRIPTIYEMREFVDAGGLMSYGVSLIEHFRRAAVYVDRLLKGARPADLPVEQPSKFELIVNRRGAKALGMTMPPSILLRADEVVE